MNTAVLVTIVICVTLTVLFVTTILVWAESQKIKAQVWQEAYEQGVWDEQTSQDWTNGEYPPARRNPYAKDKK